MLLLYGGLITAIHCIFISTKTVICTTVKRESCSQNNKEEKILLFLGGSNMQVKRDDYTFVIMALNPLVWHLSHIPIKNSCQSCSHLNRVNLHCIF